MNQYESDKKELKRIDWDIIKRLLVHLRYEGSEKKTSLAMKCNLSYDKMILYLEWLDMIGFIKRTKDDRFEMISLNERGIEFYTKKLQKVGITN